MKRTTNPVWLWHPRGSVIKHVWIAINQDKKRRPIRPRPGPTAAVSKRREREPTSGEREAATSLERKGNPFLFLIDVIFPFMYLVDFLFHVGLG